MTKRLLLSIAVLLTACVAGAQEVKNAYQFLNLTNSAHIYALGGMSVALVEDDINTVLANPALLGKEMTKQLGVNYMRYLSGGNYFGATFALQLHERGTMALGVQCLSHGKMDLTDETGTKLGTFNATDIVIHATYSIDISSRVRGGVTLKFVPSSYERYKAFAIATDLGVNYFNPDNDLSLSLTIKNLGGQVTSFNNTKDKLPWDIQIGWAQYLRNAPIRFSITATNLNKWKLPYYDKVSSTDDTMELKSSFMSNLFRHLIFGAEYNNGKFYLGLGYNYKTRTDMASYSRNFLSGISIGAGLNLSKIGFGVTYAQPYASGSTVMLNLKLNFVEFMNRNN